MKPIVTLIFIAFCSQLASQDNRPLESAVMTEKMFIDAMKEKLLGDNDEAILQFSEIVKKDPNNHASFFELAKLYKLNKDEMKSMEKAQKAAQLQPDNYYYVQFYAQGLQYNNKFKEAAEVYEVLAKSQPNNNSLQIELARLQAQAGKPDAALKTYDALEKHLGINKEVTLKKFRLLNEMGKASKASSELESYLKSVPTDNEVIDLLAKSYEKQGQKEKAALLYQHQAAKAVDDPKTAVKAAEAYRIQGKTTQYLQSLSPAFGPNGLPLDEKIKMLLPYLQGINVDAEQRGLLLSLSQKMAESHPSEAKALAMAGDFNFNFGSISEALKFYKEALSIQPSRMEIWQNRLLCSATLGLTDDLLRASQEATDLFPNHPFGYYFNGIANSLSGKQDEALNQLQLALSMSGNNPPMKAEVHAAIGTVYARMGKLGQSDASFEQALKISPSSHSVIHEYSKSLLLRQSPDLQKAQEHCQKAIKLAAMPSYEATLAKILYQKQDYSAAQKQIEIALKQIESPDWFELLGDINSKLGDEASALKNWTVAKEKGSSSSTLERKLSTRKVAD